MTGLIIRPTPRLPHVVDFTPPQSTDPSNGPMPNRRLSPILPMISAAALGLGACSGRVLAPSVADGLRVEVAERTRERDAARSQVAELQTKLAELTVARDAKIDPEAAEALPALAAVPVSGLATARWIDQNHATLALVLEPRDGLGRFMQITGTVRASVAALVPGRDPLPAGKATVGPKALRDAYRSGFLGTHYTIEIALAWEGAEAARAVSVSTEFTDALTGRTYTGQATVPILRPPPSKSTTGSTAVEGATR